MDTMAAQALIRFGLGHRPGEPLPDDPKAWLRAQLQGPDPARFPALPDSGRILADMDAVRRMRRDGQGGHGLQAWEFYRADAAAQIDQAIDGAAPFRERLVLFWANHFTVSIKAKALAPIAGCFVREAIRPHVTGRFQDMALAVMRHPAMLIYLNNAKSVGPDSLVGQNKGKGLNENLAREFMELHTVGVNAGYTQKDVTEFAKILTGWSVNAHDAAPGYLFRARTHQPGGKEVMGRGFPEGELGGLAAIEFLATHPATYRHLARKLAIHFVDDDPPEAATRRIETVLRATHGNLRAAASAVIDLPDAWSPPGGLLCKLRSPFEHAVACIRALGMPAERRPDMVEALGRLGQRLWGAPAPIGWGDRAADWGAPASVLARVDWSYALADRAGDRDAGETAAASLGPLLHPTTARAIGQAGSRRDAMTMALASPEFLRR